MKELKPINIIGGYCEQISYKNPYVYTDGEYTKTLIIGEIKDIDMGKETKEGDYIIKKELNDIYTIDKIPIKYISKYEYYKCENSILLKTQKEEYKISLEIMKQLADFFSIYYTQSINTKIPQEIVEQYLSHFSFILKSAKMTTVTLGRQEDPAEYITTLISNLPKHIRQIFEISYKKTIVIKINEEEIDRLPSKEEEINILLIERDYFKNQSRPRKIYSIEKKINDINDEKLDKENESIRIQNRTGASSYLEDSFGINNSNEIIIVQFKLVTGILRGDKFIEERISSKEILMYIDENFIVNDNKYILVGLIFHKPTTNHYVTKVKKGEKWWLLDDCASRAIEISYEEKKLENLTRLTTGERPYILFYSKNGETVDKPVDKPPILWSNTQNTCYFHSAIQNILNIRYLYELFFQQRGGGNYKQKYLKYKLKYIDLKKNNQSIISFP